MRIIIDAMGGDNAPFEIVRGALDAVEEFDISITLVGRQEEIRSCIDDKSCRNIKVVDARETIDMDDDPSTATRVKKDASMTVALRLLAEGEGDAVVSAGSTGALLTGATLITKRIRGIRRAALAPVIPNGGKGAILIDCGANVECTPEYLLQFAYMGSFFSHSILECEKPKVGLLNVGTEETKGTDLQLDAYKLLRQASEEGRINFIGNVEARDVLEGGVDVMVTDGFSGNILLKSIEGTARFLLVQIRDLLKSSKSSMLAGVMIRNKVKALRKMLDSSEVGGTALLGISKPVLKAHGSSDARAIRSAVKQAITFVEADIIGEIESNIEYMKTIDA